VARDRHASRERGGSFCCGPTARQGRVQFGARQGHPRPVSISRTKPSVRNAAMIPLRILTMAQRPVGLPGAGRCGASNA